MLYCTFIILIISGLYGFLKYKNIYNPFFLFSSIWIITIGGFLYRNKHYYSIDVITEVCFFIGILFFLIGILLGSNLKISNTTSKKNVFKFNNYVIIILTLVSIMAALCRSLHFIKLLFEGNQWNYIRYSLMASYLLTIPRLLKVLYTYISLPMSFFSINYFSYAVTYNIKRNFFLHLFNIIVVFFSDGGRTVILELIICLFINFSISQNMKKVSSLIKKHSRIVLIIFIMLFLYLTYTRFDSFIETFNGLIDNLSCSIVNFDIQRKKIVGNTLGFFSFQGFFSFIPKIEHLKFPELALRCYNLINDATQVGANITYNSYVSIFYCFYRDFNLVGVIFSSIIWGGIAGFFYRKITLYPQNIRYLFLYSFFANMILQSYTTFPFSHVKYSIYFIIIFLSNKLNIKFKFK